MTLAFERVGEYVGEFRKRRERLLAWRPVHYILLVFSLAGLLGFLISFVNSGGELSIPVLALGLFSVVLFVCIPWPSIHLFIMRAVAFLSDVLILFMTTTLAVVVLTETHTYAENAVWLEITTWIWFLYFGLSDHFFGGTPGKRLLGLGLVSLRKGKPGLFVSLLRALCILPIPIIAASYATVRLHFFHSRPDFFAAMVVRETVLCAIPVSILFYGGDQSIVDAIFRTAVRKNQQEREVDAASPRRLKRRALFFASAAAIVGLTLASVDYLVVPALFDKALPSPLGSGTALSRIEEAPKIKKALWASLVSGPRKPSQRVADVEIDQYSRNSFRPAPLLNPRTMPNYLNGYKKQKDLRVVRVFLIPPTSSLVEGEILSAVGEVVESSVSVKGRPFFIAVQLFSFLHAGPIRISYAETSLLCLQQSGGKPLYLYDEMHPWGKLGIIWSPDFTRYLLLFDGNAVKALRPFA